MNLIAPLYVEEDMRVIAGIVAMGLVSGCGVAAAAARMAAAVPVAHLTPCSPGQDTGPLKVRTLRQAAYDYQPYATPEDLARKVATVVAAGNVEGFLPGRVWQGAHQVLMRVRVGDRFKGDAGKAVRVELYQGPVASGTGKPVQTVADFERAVPTGTRVLLFLTPITDKGKGRDRSGPPPTTPIYAAHPQGIVLQEVIDGRWRLVGGLIAIGNRPAWKDRCGIDGLAGRLRKHGFTGWSRDYWYAGVGAGFGFRGDAEPVNARALGHRRNR